MQLQLVGGFLGSGKTTAIIAAARHLTTAGKTVGVITNDQGKYLVDSAFFQLAGLPTVEVSGGCFCCNYDDLDDRLGALIAAAHPEVVFAESVGSCADLVATVVKPMLDLRRGGGPAGFSVFVDSRLLRLRLLGDDLPFADDIVYIFDKQIEEAGLVILNKIDLLSDTERGELENLFKQHYPQKTGLLQDSRTPAGVEPWLACLAGGEAFLPLKTLEIDYRRYGGGEAALAWLDEQWLLDLPAGQGRALIGAALASIAAALRCRGVAVGHLKFLLESGAATAKISLTTLAEPGWLQAVPEFPDGPVRLLVNGRVQMDAEAFRALVHGALAEQELETRLVHSSAFHPGQPQPTHRY